MFMGTYLGCIGIFKLKILIDPSKETSDKIERMAKSQCRSVKNMTEVLVEKGLEIKK